MLSLKEPQNEAKVVNELHSDLEKPYRVAIPQVPITEKRKPFVPALDEELIDAGTARANVAASREYPNGTTKGDWAQRHQHQTVATMQIINKP
ncbi:hypothetical protein LTR43_011544 [Exophiala xenobiotica]|nr:hypothetical protein LTS06_010349 [Exophiala xenobiotica]KAK5284775.1 hypothetical protein LTR14_011507 [Exophiala xenobiotica]KAK5311892.1 hypothetical protein LTR93_011555 [Exophiala xenobiotica]KAK5344760.1 hypothetical protein LTR61_011473 [Exophiala xenobiotica]